MGGLVEKKDMCLEFLNIAIKSIQLSLKFVYIKGDGLYHFFVCSALSPLLIAINFLWYTGLE